MQSPVFGHAIPTDVRRSVSFPPWGMNGRTDFLLLLEEVVLLKEDGRAVKPAVVLIPVAGDVDGG